MLHIDLPRALEQYFAFAETEPTRRGRRFSITLPYYDGDRVDRLQWWYHISPAEEQMFEGEALNVYRARATQRFLRHIERWLINTRQRLDGDDTIPRISPMTVPAHSLEPAPDVTTPAPKQHAVVNG